MPDQANITTEKKSFNFGFIQTGWDNSKLMAKTFIALAFIINGVALALFAFGLVQPSREAAAIMGAISATFAAVVLFNTVHTGVKSQSTNKRKK